METNKTIEMLKNARNKTTDPKALKEIDEKIKALETGKEILK